MSEKKDADRPVTWVVPLTLSIMLGVGAGVFGGLYAYTKWATSHIEGALSPPSRQQRTHPFASTERQLEELQRMLRRTDAGK